LRGFQGRKNRYDSPQSWPLAAAQPHASGPSPTEECAIEACAAPALDAHGSRPLPGQSCDTRPVIRC